MSTRSGKAFSSPPVSPKPRNRKNNRQRTPTTPRTPASSEPYRDVRYSSSSEDEEAVSDVESIESIESLAKSVDIAATPPSAPAPATPGSSTGRRRPNTDRTNKRAGLQPWQQKIVAEDVESWGGLEKIFSNELGGVRQFCDYHATLDEEREHIYAEKGSKQRDRVRNKISYWSKIDSKEYQDLLISWNILPAEFRKFQEPTKPQASTPRSTRAQQKKSTGVSSSKKGQAQPRTTPASPVEEVEEPTVITSLPSIVSDISFGLESISIDPSAPFFHKGKMKICKLWKATVTSGTWRCCCVY